MNEKNLLITASTIINRSQSTNLDLLNKAYIKTCNIVNEETKPVSRSNIATLGLHGV